MKSIKQWALSLVRRAPRDCPCGGLGVMREEVVLAERRRIYFVQCSECDDALQLGTATIEFDTPQGAIKAWDAAVQGEPLNG